MSRKKSKYKPKPVIQDVMAYVKTGIRRVSSLGDANTVLRLKNHSAFAAVREGRGTKADINILMSVSNMATALCRNGFGEDWKAEIRAGADVIEAINNRYVRWGKVQATESEISTISLVFQIHDAQLDAVTVADVEKGISVVTNALARTTGLLNRVGGG